VEKAGREKKEGREGKEGTGKKGRAFPRTKILATALFYIVSIMHKFLRIFGQTDSVSSLALARKRGIY